MENPVMKNDIENKESKASYEKISATNDFKCSPIFNPMHIEKKSPAS
jgi:hypothetical protein